LRCERFAVLGLRCARLDLSDMCGRFAFFSAHEAITRLFGVHAAVPLEPRYNIAPTQLVPVVRVEHAATRELALLYWGLVPFWAKEKSIGARMINARAETIAEKPAFRAAYRKRRCLILADGYYEWQQTDTGKQPYYLCRADGEPFAMAGLWESWLEKEGSPALQSCAIITTVASAAVAAVHHRMPLILPRAAYSAWLDSGGSAAVLDRFLTTEVTEPLQVRAVSPRVSSAGNDDAQLIEALGNHSALPRGEPTAATTPKQQQLF
jgi:putative SOS response-associated peptidase YedK